MTDRESIVAYLRLQAKSASGGDSNDTVERVAHAATAAACQSLADQIERGVDLIPVKPRATIADLLALHDLDLGALAHAAGIIGDDLDDGDVKALCDKHSSVNDWHELVADIIPSTAATWDARQLAALGAKVRAALSAPTIKVATPRVLQSADEAPRGSLVRHSYNRLAVRWPDGKGWHLNFDGTTTKPPSLEYCLTWDWAPVMYGPVAIIAEGLTEAECRHLSGLSVADALAWCEKREAARRA